MAKQKKPPARKERDLIKANTIKSYVGDILNMRISKSAADRTRGTFNALLKAMLREATARAKAAGRSTIMPQDTDTAIAKTIEKKNLTPQDLAGEINKLSAVDIAELVNQIETIVKKRKETK